MRGTGSSGSFSGSFSLSPFAACYLPTFDIDDGEFHGLSFGLAHGDIMKSNLASAERVIRSIFQDFETQCNEEIEQHRRSGQAPSANKRNRWTVYTDVVNRDRNVLDSIEFIRGYPDCRARMLGDEQLRFLVMLQHLVALDIADFHRPASERQHCDAFEGILTKDGVNSQLVKDAHRSEWSIEGNTFLLKEAQSHETMEDRKKLIAAFQRELVTTLEGFLVGFCTRRRLSEAATMRFLQCVTTMMSQCGLANLDRSSTAGRYFVSGQGLEQRITYNLSSMDGGSVGEALKLTLLCMKTGFTQYHRAESLGALDSDGPMSCSPSSYLYQYATLRFVPGVSLGRKGLPGDQVECVVIDALDEVHIHPRGSGRCPPGASDQ
eukprot:TRINITY_DN29523_c0_g3_i2.p1 TRINITY_DN29523_c0_g3~~TRINITY_DN29523_c0_g3_i2.p1  ORF type:complete len:378 (+),score=62.19 TRINITY_DN29523_c0_g3_i2:140-1273(+)